MYIVIDFNAQLLKCLKELKHCVFLLLFESREYICAQQRLRPKKMDKPIIRIIIIKVCIHRFDPQRIISCGGSLLRIFVPQKRLRNKMFYNHMV